MTGTWSLWLVAALIGSALAFPPVTLAGTKEKKAAQPCAPAKMEEKKEEVKAEGEGKNKPAKKKAPEKKAAAQPCAPKK